jgi:hypothetical protein
MGYGVESMSDNQPFAFIARKPPHQNNKHFIYANGILADTGLPLCELDTSTAARIVKGQSDTKNEQLWATAKLSDATQPRLGTIGDVEPNNLAEAGWGIIFHAGVDQKVKQALKPLITQRQKQAGDLCRVFENADGYQPEESCSEWLARHRVPMMPVDPKMGVPFYLMIVGSPEDIPFGFQYLLDIYWAVGRLYFDAPADYRRYAESVVAYEQERVFQQSRNAAIFATCHGFDRATQMFANHVAVPLAQGDGQHNPLGKRHKFRLQSFIGDSATKETLTRLLQGRSEAGPPALLFTGSHGMGFQPDDPRLPESQGALVCQDWAGWGKIRSEEWFEASDLPADAKVHGLIHFFFACYSAGCPQVDDFVKKTNAKPGEIAPRALVAKLPQRILAHPNGGALAALGHVDRAWSYSFYSEKAGPQIQGFRDVMDRLLRGDRLGQATDQFDVRRAALSTELTEVLRDLEHGKQILDQDIVNLWIARNDARNYVVLGDPAVRLRVEDLVDHASKVTSPRVSNSASVLTSGDGDTEPKPTDNLFESDQARPKEVTESFDRHPSAIHRPNSNTVKSAKEEKKTKMEKYSKDALDFDLGNRPETVTFDSELAQVWKEHVKRAYERNEMMFDKLLKSFMQPYWTTVWMYRILFGVGVAGFIAAAVLGVWKGITFGYVFGGLSVTAFLGVFVSRPLRSLERNLQFITWLGLIFNTYWIRLAYSLNEPSAGKDIAALQRDVAKELECLIEAHTSSTDDQLGFKEKMEAKKN